MAAGGWQDNVAEMNKLVAGHPTLEWHKPADFYGPHVATWDDDEGSQREESDDLGDLVKTVKARLRPERR